MTSFVLSLHIISFLLSLSNGGQVPSSLVGTWSTKSGKVLTGPVRTISEPRRPEIGDTYICWVFYVTGETFVNFIIGLL